MTLNITAYDFFLKEAHAVKYQMSDLFLIIRVA